MPRESDFVSVHDSLAERPAAMHAGIVDGVKLAAHIGEGNRFALHLKLSDRSRRDLVRFRCARKCHLVFSLFFPTDSVNSVAFVLNAQAARLISIFYFPFSISYRGSGVCATITPRLNSSTICGFRRTSVGRFASVIWSILSCSFNSAKKSPSGRGGHPTTYTSTRTMPSTPCKTQSSLNRPPTIMRSACRGEGRKTYAPHRAISNREVVEAIISMAQHASPNVSGQMALFRAQLNT